MKRLQEKARRLFQTAGRRGGLKRAGGLTARRRRDIARAAAWARWRNASRKRGDFLQSVRLQESDWTDPVYLEEVLSFGTLADWRKLLGHLHDRPFGAEAQALWRVCRATAIYGVTPLWSGILQSLQGQRP